MLLAIRRLICRYRGHRWHWHGLEMHWEPDGGGYPMAVLCERCGYIGRRDRYPEPFR